MRVLDRCYGAFNLTIIHRFAPVCNIYCGKPVEMLIFRCCHVFIKIIRKRAENVFAPNFFLNPGYKT